MPQAQTAIKYPAQLCPRCGQMFECRAEEINNCQCRGVQLDTIILQRIAEEHGSSCLCINCLVEIKEDYVK